MGGTCSSVNHVLDIRSSTTSLDGAKDDVQVVKILIIGPSNSGKSHLIYSWIHGRKCETTIPQTQGFNMEKVISRSGVIYTMWEISGQPNMRQKRRNFYYGTQGVVYVVSNNEEQEEYWKDVNEDIASLFRERDLNHVPLLLVVNKIAQSDTLPNNLVKLKETLPEYVGLKQFDVVHVDLEQPSDIQNALNKLESHFCI